MKFNIGTTEIASQSTGGTRLAANTIHNVKFDGAEAVTIDKKDGSASFDVLRLKFKNDEGTFEHVIFEPKAGDDVRQKNQFDSDNPSNLENLIFTIKHLLVAVAPTVAKQIEDKGILVDGWNGDKGLRQFVVKNTEKATGAETQIKLLSDKDNNPQFPGFPLGMSKEGNVYPRTNFIGKDLKFTPAEIKRMNSVATATPSRPAASATTSAEDDDLVF